MIIRDDRRRREKFRFVINHGGARMATLNSTMAREFGARLIQFADTLEDCSARERLLALMDRTSAGTFHLVVVGEIKKGKSKWVSMR
ncbi:hypothetical protein [uncultured Thiocystis sp.]|jgi:hypothetical protein|uniref:hypothetical protein n=1 Tax=uncultured Thiocystis sp. TaxID=1202134 RepID=UPI0025FF8CA5|nr:hypothetical protein [uncultured Thiocystis sp.]